MNNKTKLPGRIYKKHNKRADGTVVEHTTWTVRYKGKDYATGETIRRRAEQFLSRLIAGTPAPAPVIERPWKRALAAEPKEEAPVLMKEVFANFLADAVRRDQPSLSDKQRMVKQRLGPFFGLIPVKALTSGMINSYIDQRRAEGAANGTVNRELTALKRSLKLGEKTESRDGKPGSVMVERIPAMTLLKEATPRQGFLNHADFLKVQAFLPDYLVPMFTVGYFTGNRVGELRQIEVQDVDMDALQYRLYPDATKNGEGRVIPMYGEVARVFAQQLATMPPGCTFVFHNDGKPIRYFFKSWRTATEAAGMGGKAKLLFHDLRRTAVRNLVRSGLSRKICMKITGHKTEQIFERYNIIDEADMREAVAKMDSYMATLDKAVPRQRPS